MNVRILLEVTPAKRLAAAFRAILNEYSVPYPHIPDYADLVEYIQVYVQYELTNAELNADRSPEADQERRRKLKLFRDEIERRHNIK